MLTVRLSWYVVFKQSDKSSRGVIRSGICRFLSKLNKLGVRLIVMAPAKALSNRLNALCSCLKANKISFCSVSFYNPYFYLLESRRTKYQIINEFNVSVVDFYTRYFGFLFFLKFKINKWVKVRLEK